MGWVAIHRDTGDRIEGPNDYNVRDAIRRTGGDPQDAVWQWEMTRIIHGWEPERPDWPAVADI